MQFGSEKFRRNHYNKTKSRLKCFGGKGLWVSGLLLLLLTVQKRLFKRDDGSRWSATCLSVLFVSRHADCPKSLTHVLQHSTHKNVGSDHVNRYQSQDIHYQSEATTKVKLFITKVKQSITKVNYQI